MQNWYAAYAEKYSRDEWRNYESASYHSSKVKPAGGKIHFKKGVIKGV